MNHCSLPTSLFVNALLLQTNFAPILATAAKVQLGIDGPQASAAAPSVEASSGSGTSGLTLKPESAKHHALLLELVSEQLGINPSDIVDFELNVST